MALLLFLHGHPSRVKSACPIQSLPPEALDETSAVMCAKPGSWLLWGSDECHRRFPGALNLATYTNMTERVRIPLHFFGFLLLGSGLGCSNGRDSCQEGVSQRILPPANTDICAELPVPRNTA